MGVMMYEFLYGYPPFNAETTDIVFSNILARNIDWQGVEVSDSAHDLMDRLMCLEISHRIGTESSNQVKSHEFFSGVEWGTLLTTTSQFIPKLASFDDTDYFDDRGLSMDLFDDEEESIMFQNDYESTSEFGDFSYKNLPLLEKQNNELVKKLSFSNDKTRSPRISVSKPKSLSPSPQHHRNLSGLEQEDVKRVLQNDANNRRNSLPSRLRTNSLVAGNLVKSPMEMINCLIEEGEWSVDLEQVLDEIGCGCKVVDRVDLVEGEYQVCFVEIGRQVKRGFVVGVCTLGIDESLVASMYDEILRLPIKREQVENVLKGFLD